MVTLKCYLRCGLKEKKREGGRKGGADGYEIAATGSALASKYSVFSNVSSVVSV